MDLLKPDIRSREPWLPTHVSKRPFGSILTLQITASRQCLAATQTVWAPSDSIGTGAPPLDRHVSQSSRCRPLGDFHGRDARVGSDRCCMRCFIAAYITSAAAKGWVRAIVQHPSYAVSRTSFQAWSGAKQSSSASTCVPGLRRLLVDLRSFCYTISRTSQLLLALASHFSLSSAVREGCHVAA